MYPHSTTRIFFSGAIWRIVFTVPEEVEVAVPAIGAVRAVVDAFHEMKQGAAIVTHTS